MKLNQFLLLTLSIAIFSCSSDSDNSPNEETNNGEPNNDSLVLLKKSIETDGDGEIHTTTYEYDGNKLTRFTETDTEDENFEGITNYLYENDRIIEINSRGYPSTHKTVLKYNDDDTLSSHTITDTEGGSLSVRVERHDFEYQVDGTITERIFLQNAASEFVLLHTITIFFNGSNRTKDTEGIEETIYKYDDKNGIFKNVSSISTLNLISSDYGGSELATLNNLTDLSEIQSGNIIEFDTYEYTYNSSDYPESAKHNFDGELSTIEFFY